MQARLVRGIGDDAAVVLARGVCVTSVDALVEGVHFRLGEGWLTPAQVGRRALATALSDLAAMGAEAGEAYVVLVLPRGFAEQRALELVRAAAEFAAACGVTIAGGDVVVGPALIVSITAVGWAERADQLVGRDGARDGDLVGVTGPLGGAGAALAVMEGRARSLGGGAAAAREPVLRLLEGRALAAAGVHAMIDLSDGIATDAGHLARASGARLQIELPSLPLAAGVLEVSAELGVPTWRLAATAGEDHELCFCAAPEDRERLESAVRASGGGGSVSWVGCVVDGPTGVSLLDEQGTEVRLEGFEHQF